MNTKEAIEKIERLASQGLIKEEAVWTLIESVKALGAEGAAMRDHLFTILAVVIEEEGEAGPFTVARQFLDEADIGGAELDYRSALEEAARACLETFGASETPAIKRLAHVLSQSPALFIKTDRLELFLDRAASIADGLSASIFTRRYPLEVDQLNELRRVIFNSITDSIIIDVGMDCELDQCWATITPKGFDESAASSKHKPERDRLDNLLSDAADDAMEYLSDLDDIGSLDPYEFQRFESAVLDAIGQRLEIVFESTVEGDLRSTEYSVKLKGD